MLKGPFEDPERRRELIARFAAIDGFVFPADAEVRYPNVPLALLLDESALAAFLGSSSGGSRCHRRKAR